MLELLMSSGRKTHYFFTQFLICRPQYFPKEVQTICRKFKETGNRVDFLNSLSPADNPQGLQTIGCKLLALIDELPPLPCSLEICLSVSYLNK